MCRIAGKLALLALWAAVLQSPLVEASDGDVDYSAPYITVDPETGELVTVNPGPSPAMHDMAAAQQRDAGQARHFPSDATATGTAEHGDRFLMLAVVGAGLLAVIIFAVRRGRRSRDTGSAPIQRG